MRYFFYWYTYSFVFEVSDNVRCNGSAAQPCF